MQGLTVWVFRHSGCPGRGQGGAETGEDMTKGAQVGLCVWVVGFRGGSVFKIGAARLTSLTSLTSLVSLVLPCPPRTDEFTMPHPHWPNRARGDDVIVNHAVDVN